MNTLSTMCNAAARVAKQHSHENTLAHMNADDFTEISTVSASFSPTANSFCATDPFLEHREAESQRLKAQVSNRILSLVVYNGTV